MDKRIVWKLSDGSVQITQASSDKKDLSETDEEYLDRIAIHTKNSSEALKDAVRMPDILDADYCNKDRYFRNAWTWNNGIEVDLPKAKEIHKEKLRQLRKPLLEKLDVEFMQAIESGLDTKVIAKKKKDLRDITIHPEIDSAKTPEELKIAALSILK